MPFKEYNPEIQIKVNKLAVKENLKNIELHARQIQYLERKETARQRIDKLFKRKEGQ